MSRDTKDVESEDVPDLETVRSEGVGINSCMINSVRDIIENQVSNGNILQSVSVDEDQTGKDGKNKTDCFTMKSIRAKLSRPKIPKIFRKSKGESSVAESESKELLNVDKKSKLKVIPTEEQEEVEVGTESLADLPSTGVVATCKTEPAAPRAPVSLNPTGQGEADTEIGIREMERSSKLSSTKVQPTLVPSQTTGRVNLS